MNYKRKHDKSYRRFWENCYGSIQTSTADRLFNKYVIFSGAEGSKYYKGKLENPTVSAIFKSVKDLWKFYKCWGDLTESFMMNLRGKIEISGNVNFLAQYGFLANFINPKVKKVRYKK